MLEGVSCFGDDKTRKERKRFETMKLGVIGSGVIVQEFLPKLVKLEGMEVAGVMNLPECIDQVRELCEKSGVKNACTSFDELCGLGIDTVYVAVPNFLHYTYCCQALERGLNVIVEKPMTSNAREAKELRDLAEKNNAFIFEAITTVYFEAYQVIKEWLKKIGTVKLVTCNYSQYSRRYDAFRSGETLPAFDPKKSGGALMDINLYNLHYVMGLFGKPNSVKYYANVERGIDTSGMLMLSYDGFVANCTAAKDCSAPFFNVIEGTDGYITISYPPNLIGTAKLTMNDKSEEVYEEKMAMDRLIPEFTAFIRAINENDRAFYEERMAASIAVSEVQTDARLDAGIIFPADETN